MSAGATQSLEEHEVTAFDGTRLHAQVFRPEKPSGESCILVHGIASHSAWYAPLAHGLREGGVTAVVFDRRGSGRSGGPRGHMASWKHVTQDLFSVVDTILGRDSTFHVAGLSLGALFALSASMEKPHRVDRLLLSAPAIFTRVSVPLAKRLATVMQAFATPEKLVKLPFRVSDIVHRTGWSEALSSDPLRTRAVSARFLLEYLKLQRSVRKNLSHLASPTRILLAGQDRVIDTPATEACVEATAAPIEAITYTDASHVLTASIPAAELLNQVLHWIIEKPAAGASGRLVTKTEAYEAEALAPPPNLS